MAAATAPKALLLSRFNDFIPLKPSLPQSILFPFRSTTKPSPSSSSSSSTVVVSCFFSGLDGGGVADDFISTRKSGFDRGFSVISKLLKRIEPFDTTSISKGVSLEARESMKQTISSMLGLLPSDQFEVIIRVSPALLDQLLANSIVTGYTLWNAEYRLSLSRNFDVSPADGEAPALSTEEGGGENVDEGIPQGLGDLSPGALEYIMTLKSQLATAKKELNAKKQENLRLDCNGVESTELLLYLRSLEPNVVNEVSSPSSFEVEVIIDELAKNVLQRLFPNGSTFGFLEDSIPGKAKQCLDGAVELCGTIDTSRDYLAKLLFWCMLMGHHLRSLENRLQLSCVVGLL